ncbi:MurR/RpiR family transcriptional regulator [Halomonas sp. E19]|uniref:MurR/RpiR family transcriptional regulator n=1 Tax=Halomonas sp. E19 TaxID=3397247 RepID=UPI004033E63E
MTDTTTPPPETLSGLRQRLKAIEAGEADIRLGKRSRHVLALLIEAPQQAAVSSISELADQLGVNASTLSRLAQRLGYGGFGQLQDVFRREVTEGQSFYSDQASRLLEAGGDTQGLTRLSRLGRQESANMASLLERIDPAAFEQTVTLLARAHRVRVHGMRQFHSLALFMAYGLGMLRPDVAPSTRAGKASPMPWPSSIPATYWWWQAAFPTRRACWPPPRWRPATGSWSSP